MFKEQIASLVRYMLAGLVVLMGEQLVKLGFDPESANSIATAAGAFAAALILGLWSLSKNKKNVAIKKEFKEIKYND